MRAKLTNLLDIGNQANSREISTRILGLTQGGVDDNATVKVITVFTLIYLPASFMAVSNKSLKINHPPALADQNVSHSSA
jgi:hypothetical protein